MAEEPGIDRIASSSYPSVTLRTFYILLLRYTKITFDLTATDLPAHGESLNVMTLGRTQNAIRKIVFAHSLQPQLVLEAKFIT